MNHMAEQIKQASKEGVEVFASAAQTALGAVERLAALNLNMARQIMARNETNSRSMMGTHTPDKLVSLHTNAMLEDSRLAMNYSRRAIEISSEASQHLASLFARRD